MSHRQKPPLLRLEWRRLTVIPWYRQLLSLIYGLGVILIAVWAIDQGNGVIVIAGTVAMSFLTLMLIFGVEIEYIQIGENRRIQFPRRNDDE